MPIPIAMCVGAWQMDPETLSSIRWAWATIITLYGFILLAFFVSVRSLKVPGRRAWAVAGTVISGLEVLYMLAGIVSIIRSGGIGPA